MADHKILIIEDNPINRKIMRDLLRFHHYETLEAVNGLEGVQMAQDMLPDLILMDIQLPELDGYSATKQIKSNEKTQQIPIVAVTSFAMKGEADKAKEAGCDAYITKPIDIHQVIKTVREFLSGPEHS